MNRERRKEIAEALRMHADVMFYKIPAGEQFIGARDAVMHEVLHLLAEVVEAETRPTEEPK